MGSLTFHGMLLQDSSPVFLTCVHIACFFEMNSFGCWRSGSLMQVLHRYTMARTINFGRPHWSGRVLRIFWYRPIMGSLWRNTTSSRFPTPPFCYRFEPFLRGSSKFLPPTLNLYLMRRQTCSPTCNDPPGYSEKLRKGHTSDPCALLPSYNCVLDLPCQLYGLTANFSDGKLCSNFCSPIDSVLIF